MKRVLSALAVVAIVSSALAFAPAKKGGVFCASTTSGVGNCTRVFEKTEINNGNTGTQYYKYNAWDGNPANCTATTNCNTSVIFYPEI